MRLLLLVVAVVTLGLAGAVLPALVPETKAMLALDAVGSCDLHYGLHRELLFTGTQYSEGYSHQGFTRLRKGMSRAQVRQLVGWPLTTTRAPVDEEWWQFSRGEPGSFRQREVVFDGSGLVAAIRHGVTCKYSYPSSSWFTPTILTLPGGTLVRIPSWSSWLEWILGP
ncbi:MAG: outer membrane protein assembly factor BamE [Myxococcales bacterium]